ncbi:hypothetical protein GQ457_03G009940 [Hibiscus cannabinus]
MTFQDPWYRYPKGDSVSNLGTDTQREYRYPRAGTDTLRLGTDTLGYRYPKPWYRYPLSKWQNWLEKHPQRLQTRSNGHQRLESLLGP